MPRPQTIPQQSDDPPCLSIGNCDAPPSCTHVEHAHGTAAAPKRRLLTTQQVHDEYGLSINTLRSDRSTGLGLPFLRHGQALLYDRNDIEAWIKEAKTGQSSNLAFD